MTITNKKLISLIIALFLVFECVGCAYDTPASEPEEEVCEHEHEEEAVQEEETAEPEPEPVTYTSEEMNLYVLGDTVINHDGELVEGYALNENGDIVDVEGTVIILAADRIDLTVVTEVVPTEETKLEVTLLARKNTYDDVFPYRMEYTVEFTVSPDGTDFDTVTLQYPNSEDITITLIQPEKEEDIGGGEEVAEEAAEEAAEETAEETAEPEQQAEEPAEATEEATELAESASEEESNEEPTDGENASEGVQDASEEEQEVPEFIEIEFTADEEGKASFTILPKKDGEYKLTFLDSFDTPPRRVFLHRHL